MSIIYYSDVIVGKVENFVFWFDEKVSEIVFCRL